MARVLVACETSGVVRDAFLASGHDAISCDILPTDVEGPHYQGDVRDILYDNFDLMIGHPPCNHLAISGARWFKDKKMEQEEALAFVRLLMEAPINRIAIENPVSIISTHIRKPEQIIQPYQFGEDASKRTCLWLKNLPPLVPTNYVEPRIINGLPRWANQTDSGQNKLGQTKGRAKERGTTYRGIAQAFVDQWSPLLEE